MGKIAAKLSISTFFLSGGLIHVLYPKLTVDLIVLACLAGVITPWFAPVLIPALRAMKSKLPRFKSGTLGTKGLEVQFEARAEAPPPTALSTSAVSILEVLAEDAEQSIAGFEAGAGNVDAMVNLFVKIEGRAQSLSIPEITRLLNSAGAGSRLIAYIRLQRFPDPSLAATLARALTIEENASVQWWCIQALRRLQTIAPQALTSVDLRRLRTHLKKLPRRSDRRSELHLIIDEAGLSRGGKPAESPTANTPNAMQGP